MYRPSLYHLQMMMYLKQSKWNFLLDSASKHKSRYMWTRCSQHEPYSFTQIGTNGYFTFDGFNGYTPFSFDTRNQTIVAPFFTDLIISYGVGKIEYEIHTHATSNAILSDVNELINNCTEKNFTGDWMLVATWEDVAQYGVFPYQNTVSYRNHPLLLLRHFFTDKHIPGNTNNRLSKFICRFHLLLWRFWNIFQ